MCLVQALKVYVPQTDRNPYLLTSVNNSKRTIPCSTYLIKENLSLPQNVFQFR